MIFIRLLPLGASVLLGGCASMQVAEFARQRPLLDPVSFFSGHTTSAGVMENRSGAPIQRVTTQTSGHWEGDTLRLEQDLEFGDGKKQHRSWRIRRLDPNHFEATANDMVGTARGEAYGNAFHWSFTLALSPGNPLSHVTMSQWMYLQPDGRTLINHTTIRKFGLVLAQVTEQFRQLDQRAPAL
ncbi:MAG: DUF3833 family protein [Chthoniobacterales bacterium]|nr:DUF3833 family protein [Chthoniobacterales bacterium]